MARVALLAKAFNTAQDKWNEALAQAAGAAQAEGDERQGEGGRDHEAAFLQVTGRAGALRCHAGLAPIARRAQTTTIAGCSARS
jgi:hypothetical protein